MKRETLYHFIPSKLSSQLLEDLLRLKAGGDHLGFTYPKADTHTCFNSQQEAELARIIEPYVAKGMDFERVTYYHGNLSGEDFGISTFRQPIAQWRPVPIASVRDRSIFEKGEPWGLTTDGRIAIATTLRQVIASEIHGLVRDGMDGSGMFDWYKIISDNVKGLSDDKYQDSPVSVDEGHISRSQDIWKYASDSL